jgi:hypothetical protein
LTEICTFDVLHGNEKDIVVGVEIENAYDIWMDEAARITAFVPQQIDHGGGPGKVRVQDLESNALAELPVLGQPNISHASLAIEAQESKAI